MNSVLRILAVVCSVLHVQSSPHVCPTGWKLFENYCFFFSVKINTWLGAKSECEKYGGYLAEPYTKHLDDFVTGYTTNTLYQHWIGLSDRLTEGSFIWEHSKRPVSESNWYRDRPNVLDGDKDDCVFTNYFRQWADVLCDSGQRYICQVEADCASGWEKKGSNCYWFSDDKKTWQEAKTSCEEKGAVLAEPKSKETDDYISGAAIQKGVRYWIGLNDITDEGKFTWQSNSEPISFSNWVSGDPNNGGGGNEDCVLTNWNQKWADAPCSWTENYACQAVLLCPYGWQRFENFCFFFSDTRVPWLKAKIKCQEYGGYLAEPSTKTLDGFVSGYSISKGVQYWIGLNDRLNEGKFVWEHTGKPISDSNWYPGRPDEASGNEDCVLTNLKKQWDDGNCDWPNKYVCQKLAECKPDVLGKEYRGKVNTTKTGIQCMVWSATTPHTAWDGMIKLLTLAEGTDISNTNYCRNPDNEPEGPWCYTMDPSIRWQYCDIPLCSKL